MGNAWKHFKTITYHKYLVAKGCFQVGLYKQGILHDLSKYSPSEFLTGVRYYQGTRSPNDAERELQGYSAAWLHHKGRNKHHYEYWMDYSRKAAPGEMVPVPMPDRYIAEMIMDRIAACKVYKGKNYTDRDAYDYFVRSKNLKTMHVHTAEMLERMLKILAEDGEKAMYAVVRRELVCRKGTDNKRELPNKIQ